MKTKTFWGALCLLLLTACGPMIGSNMVASNEVKDFKVVEGNLSDLQPGSRLVVLGPFDKTPQAFYICRGEDAAAFVSALNMSGLFAADLEINERFPDKLPTVDDFSGKNPAEVQKALGIQQSPDLLMSGTILSREMTAAPTKGVIMTAAYRLEFLSLKTGKKTIVEIKTQELFQNVIPVSVDYLAQKVSMR